MEQAILVVLGAALTWAFYFVQRRVEKRRTTEAIERSEKLLALKQGLEGAKTSLGELQRFESGLVGKAQSAVERRMCVNDSRASCTLSACAGWLSAAADAEA